MAYVWIYGLLHKVKLRYIIRQPTTMETSAFQHFLSALRYISRMTSISVSERMLP